ncbi:energy-coupled thiamine transporter ThiT [Veillonella intestinalis]|uniref:energy-coupled thiamine transporter ThiT n=1 Tax=Veillonella intestinalis TaxID=2941341 RepID=UPI00203CEE37|nr:energy-coupled thiamine transporter ThiT [Veillonella intestinalis]
MEQKQRTRMLVEAGLSIAIAYVLHFVVLFQMPQGGSVNAANLVPLIIFALRWGGKWGLITCMAYGLIEFLLGFKFSLHFLSILLDYILGYGAIGMAGFFANTRSGAIGGVLVGCSLRWLCSVVSGAVVFAAYAPAGQNPWLYSMIYNASYMVPELAINLLVIVLFYTRIMKGLQRR